MEKQELIEQLNINLKGITDAKVKETILYLFNLIEELSTTNRELQQEIQQLGDENNRLKGEQGKPKIKANKKEMVEPEDISSEKERHKGDRRPKRQRATKKDKIKIDRIELCEVDKELLPADAEFKGYERVVVQDLQIATDNIEFKKELYYSPAKRKSYRGKLPRGYEGEFGPKIKALALIMKNVSNTSEPKILDFFTSFNIKISSGTLSNILIKKKEPFHQEKDELFKAGLQSSSYQQMDETKARVEGKNYHTHIVCNPFYTAYFSTEHKDRLTTLKILLNNSELKYCLNQQAFTFLGQLKVAEKYINELNRLQSDQEFDLNEFDHLLVENLPSLKKRVKGKILEAAAIASYRQRLDFPVVKTLLCDDAPQFKTLTEELALCWVHDGRHYKKLRPLLPFNADKLDQFIELYWYYYSKLYDYKSSPSPKSADLLSSEFDQLFSSQTDYQQLDERILKTKLKKENLLLVLKYPQLPLHNNASELAARVLVRKRDVSLHTLSPEGTKANVTFLSIVQTCKKFGVNAYDFIFDRINHSFNLPPLAQLIEDKSLVNVIIPSSP